MDFENFLRLNSKEVNECLSTFLTEYIDESNKVNPKLGPLLEVFRDSCQGGKRVRAALIRLGFRLGEGDENLSSEVLKIAAGYEIFQTAILAHDDIIDKDELRRGRPSLYMLLGGDHYGISQAIILSDIGFFLCIRAINQTKFSSEIKFAAIESFTQTFLKTGLGEMLDVEVSFKGTANTQDIETVNLLKTADYSVVGPLKMGLVLSGNTQLLNSIETFGRYLGVAFQLQDDYLGIFGAESETGKSASSDIKEGKITLLYLTALEKSDSSEKEILKRLYGKKDLTEQEAEQVRRVFRDTEAADYCQEESLRLANLAKAEVENMVTSGDNRQTLLAMANFLIERTK